MKRRFTFLIFYLFVFSLFFGQSVLAQTKSQRDIEIREKVITKTNVNTLNRISVELENEFKAEKEEAIKIAKGKGWAIREESKGKVRELMKIAPDGSPIYYTTFNANCAIATRANTLHNGGLLGLNLEGQGMTAYVWDAGLALASHQEYDGIGGDDRYSVGDGTTAMHFHAAHVTGTIMASGVKEEAKGMAPQSHVVGSDWNNDIAEAAIQASNGMLISNHSYGWDATKLNDWIFGAYVGDSKNWDEVLYNAPYYLMCIAAGNDGDDNVSNNAPLDSDPNFDKLSGHATAKNPLVVANGKSFAIDSEGNLVSNDINSSSSEGPTDDYRIKPDITGNGTAVYSTVETSSSAYNSLTGTSMASPNVSGTLLLLQQHYNNINSEFMRAATLKGLALHTADDAGIAGPDAIFGWGVLNAKLAAQTINKRNNGAIISEQTLANNETYTMDVFANGSEDLVVSISWTDPAGQANEGTPNLKTPVLVNDLDIRIYEGANTYFPYYLTGINSNAKGDNIVDPYEKIVIENPTPGTKYSIEVTHKGALLASQAYSFIVTGISGDSPNTFAAVSNDPNQIDLSWNKNVDNDDVIIAWSADGVFGDLVNQATYNVTDVITGGGTIIYKGDAISFSHGSLTENTKYYYKIWSVKTSGDYSAGVSTNEVTIKSTATNYPTDFAAGTPTGTTIPLTWTDATGAVVPDGYLIKASKVGFNEIVAPVNGVVESNERLVKNVEYGQETFTFDSLKGVSTYFFKIYPYTNSGVNIMYKTDAEAPQVTAVTDIDPCEGITLPYSENFDSGDNCWNGVTGTDSWLNVVPTTPVGDHTGSGKCFVTHGNNEYNTSAQYLLISPNVSLYGFTDCQLTFWIYMNAEPSGGGDYWDGGYIEAFDGTEWKKLTTSLPYDGTLSSGNVLGATTGWSPEGIRDWTQVTVDLTEYDENPNFQFRIVFGSDGAEVGAGWAVDDVEITGTASCTAPTGQATDFAASNITYNSMTVEWARAASGGDNVLVVVREMSADHSDPEKGIAYTSNPEFGLGDEIGTGNYVVYNGTGTDVNITGLKNVTEYNFSIYEYFAAENCYNLIELSGSETTSPKTAPTNHATNFATGTPEPTVIPLTWTDAVGTIEADGYLIYANTTGVFVDPTNTIPVSDDTDLSDGSGVVNIAQGLEEYTFTNLYFDTQYHFRIYSYTNHGDQIVYKTDGDIPTVTESTLIDPCSINITELPFTETFSDVVEPQCWDNIDNNGDNMVWQFGTIGGVSFGTDNYAYLNSDGYGLNKDQDADLITHTFDFSLYTDVTLSFNHFYRHVGYSSATLSYSIDNGLTWVEIEQWTASTANPTNFSQIINALDGQAQVKFKFNYIGKYSYYWCIDDLDVTGTKTCTPPANQATDFSVISQDQTSLTIGWTRPTINGGDKILVLVKEGAEVSSDPIVGANYTANSVFEAGDLIGDNNYAVYSGSDNETTISGLSGVTDYHFAIYEYHSASNCYLIPGLTGVAATNAKAEPSNHVTSFASGIVTSNMIPLTWTDATGTVEPDGYLILANTTGSFIDPTDANPVSDDLNLSDGSGAKNILPGEEAYTFDGLELSTQYFFKIYPYTNNGTDIDYKTDATPAECNATTLSDPCVIDLAVEDYIEGFESPIAPNIPECTSVENTNSDAKEWITSTSLPNNGLKHLSIQWDGSNAMDDWFFSAPLELEAGYQYELSFWYRAHSSMYDESLEVKLGTSNNSSAMTIEQLFDNSAITNETYAQTQITFTVSEDGIYYLGWHGYSIANQWNLYVDDISVTRGEAANSNPTVENAIADISKNEGFSSTTVDLTDVFADADGDALTYSAESDMESVVTVAVSGNTLTITEVGIGTANITVTANDGNGGTVDDIFEVAVNKLNTAPVVDNGIDNMRMLEGFATNDVDLSGVFSDADGDALIYSAESDMESVVTVAISGNTLTITEVGLGTANITVTANDGNGGTVNDEFSFRVKSNPRIKNAIADISKNEGFSQFEIDLTGVFEDSDGDVLSYSVLSDDETVVAAQIDGVKIKISEIGVGVANITVTADDGTDGTVSDEFKFIVNKGTSIDDLNKISVKVYPNPAQEYIYIEMDNANNEELSFEIFNLIGQKLYSEEVKTNSGQLKYQINISDFIKGVYLLRIQNGTKSFVERVNFQ